jgi:hypothetical protein
MSQAPSPIETDGRVVAVIGTAGRDKARPMTKQLWAEMLIDVRSRVREDDVLVSGGAAWADHLAVAMYLEGRVKALVLHLPAPMEKGQFKGPNKSAASAANFYHDMFRQATGTDGLKEIGKAIAKGAVTTHQPEALGYGAMFARNAWVAKQSTAVIAYTFGEGDDPQDGGTKNTWDQIKGEKIHVPLGTIGKANLVNSTSPKTADVHEAVVTTPAMSKRVIRFR